MKRADALRIGSAIATFSDNLDIGIRLRDLFVAEDDRIAAVAAANKVARPKSARQEALREAATREMRVRIKGGQKPYTAAEHVIALITRDALRGAEGARDFASREPATYVRWAKQK